MALAKQNLDISTQNALLWVYNRRIREWEAIPTRRRVKDINAALHTAQAYASKLEAGIFTATPIMDTFGKQKRGWYCSAKFCGEWNICPAKYLNDDKNENELAIRSW